MAANHSEHQKNNTHIFGCIKQNTVNWEIFVHENIHALTVCVNKFSWVPHKKFITAHACSYYKRQLVKRS